MRNGLPVFKFHDIRRKAATNAEKLKERYARQLLGHHSQQMTARYIKRTSLIEGLEKEFY